MPDPLCKQVSCCIFSNQWKYTIKNITFPFTWNYFKGQKALRMGYIGINTNTEKSFTLTNELFEMASKWFISFDKACYNSQKVF